VGGLIVPAEILAVAETIATVEILTLVGPEFLELILGGTENGLKLCIGYQEERKCKLSFCLGMLSLTSGRYY